jgi:exodeoxyribonuclease V alpha subunit
MVKDVYFQLSGTGMDYGVQVLSTTRNGAAGIRRVKQMLHDQFHNHNVRIQSINKEFGVVPKPRLTTLV